MAAKRVLVQAGHLAPREPGIPGLGATGEVQLTKQIRDRLVKILEADDRFKAIPAPGDIPDGISVDAALYLHADGFIDPKAGGFSFGFPVTNNNKKFAGLIRQEFLQIPGHPKSRTDNGTADAAQYYAYRRVNTPFEVLVEHGFVSNPTEHEWLKKNVGNLAEAEYHAVCKLFGLAPKNGTQPAGARHKLESIHFLVSDADDPALARAAVKACKAVGLDAHPAGSDASIARHSRRALKGPLGQFVAAVVGNGTEAKLPPEVKSSLRSAAGKWKPTNKSDLWDCTGDRDTARRKIERRLGKLAEFEGVDGQKMTETFRAAL
jgi:hypothetical protein